MTEGKITLEDITRNAIALAGLSPEDWMKTNAETRDEFLAKALNVMFTEAEQAEILASVAVRF